MSCACWGTAASPSPAHPATGGDEKSEKERQEDVEGYAWSHPATSLSEASLNLANNLSPTAASPLQLQRTRVLRFVNPDPSASRQRKRSHFSPALFLHIRNRHLFRLKLLQRRPNVVAHKVKLVPVILIRIVKRRLRRRHFENQPAMPRVD